MQFAGYIPEDSPNPMDEAWTHVAQMPVAPFTLTSQHTLEEYGPGIGTGSDATGVRDMQVALSYTVIRNPADRDDPANLTDLDEETRKALDAVPPQPVPKWMAELTERMRYPSIWEAVKTHWTRDADDQPTIEDALAEHTEHVLRNSFRAQRGLEGKLGSLPTAPDVTTTSVQHDVTLRINGVDRPAVQIDADPHVYAIGAVIDDSTLVTVVISRDELPYVNLELATHTGP